MTFANVSTRAQRFVSFDVAIDLARKLEGDDPSRFYAPRFHVGAWIIRVIDRETGEVLGEF